MSDNITLSPGAGGSNVATDDVSGVHFQKVKLDVGGDGVSVPVVGGLPTLPVVSESSQSWVNPTAASSPYVVACAGYPAARVWITHSSSAFVELSFDGGLTYTTPHLSIILTPGGFSSYGNGGSGASAPHTILLNLDGATHIRVRWNSAPSAGTYIARVALLGESLNLMRGKIAVETTNTDMTNSVPGSFVQIGAEKRGSERSGSGTVDSGWSNALISDPVGRLVTTPYQIPALRQRACLDGITVTTSQQLHAAVASYKHYVNSITIANEGAAGTVVELLDGSTVIWLGYVAAGKQEHVTFPVPIGGTVNTALNARCRTASTVHISTAGYRSQV